METLTALTPLLLVMLVLMACSGFFSASESALFFLSANDRRLMKSGSASEKAALKLLDHPDHLLSAILFSNLLVNFTYFSLASVCTLRMERDEDLGSTWAVAFAMGSLLVLVLIGEMLAKTVGVIAPRSLSKLAALPLTWLVYVESPLTPVVKKVVLVSTRLLWPNFRPEPLINLADLEQAIELTSSNEVLIQQEQAVLQNIVHLSDIRIEEWMRPRSQLKVFKAPLALSDLEFTEGRSDYLMIGESGSDEIEKAIRLEDHFHLPSQNLEKLAQPVLYLPWSASVGLALEKMSNRNRDVTVVVNEFGETVGVLTVDDILETMFTYSPSRVERILERKPIVEIEPGKWLVQGLTNLRILSRRLNLELPPHQSITVAGLIQQQLQRLAEVDDQCQWGPCHFRVVETAKRGSLVAELTLRPETGEEQP
jgi:CBS domain containing-hemolysin-like protein